MTGAKDKVRKRTSRRYRRVAPRHPADMRHELAAGRWAILPDEHDVDTDFDDTDDPRLFGDD